MNEQRQDLDFIEFILILWKDKLLITLFAFAFASIGSIYFFIKIDTEIKKGVILESTISYEVNNLLPFGYKKERVISDFKKLFYSSDLFATWKANNKQSEITFENLSRKKIVDGMELEKNKEEKMVIFDNLSINLFIKKTSLLPDFYHYLNFINEELTSKLVLYANNQLELIMKEYDEFNSNFSNTPNPGYIVIKTELIQYLSAIDNGESALKINSPTISNKKVLMRFSLFRFVILGMLGAMMGTLISITRDALLKRQS